MSAEKQRDDLLVAIKAIEGLLSDNLFPKPEGALYTGSKISKRDGYLIALVKARDAIKSIEG